MAFEILPAIDVAGGRLVTVSAGGPREVEAFGGSPLAAAESFVAAGARWLHVVDVDRANGGEPDLGLVGAVSALGARVQASGGITSRRAADEALAAGARRVVLSSSILSDRALTADLVARLGSRAVVGIEADGDILRSRGLGAVELPLDETLGWLRSVAAAGYLYTGLSRVARLTGPDLGGVRRISRALDRPILAAGGVHTPEDVRALRALGPDTVEGCVVGRALYEEADLAELLAAAR